MRGNQPLPGPHPLVLELSMLALRALQGKLGGPTHMHGEQVGQVDLPPAAGLLLLLLSHHGYASGP